MAEDNLQEVRRVMGGHFYGMYLPFFNKERDAISHAAACPRGHPYFVGEVSYSRQSVTIMLLMLCFAVSVWTPSAGVEM